jgi:hypothetical protein
MPDRRRILAAALAAMAFPFVANAQPRPPMPPPRHEVRPARPRSVTTGVGRESLAMEWPSLGLGLWEVVVGSAGSHPSHSWW